MTAEQTADLTAFGEVGSGHVAIPLRFWQELSEAECRDIFVVARGELNRRQCRRVWQMLRRTDRPPESMVLVFSVAELKRIRAERYADEPKR